MSAIETVAIGAGSAVAILMWRRIVLALFVLFAPSSWIVGGLLKAYPKVIDELKKKGIKP